jgi:DMSO/TMAO reductase YedYZ heme-binding membrane subunit
MVLRSLGPGVPLEVLIVRPQLRLGVVAGAILAILAATSFTAVVRRLRVRWWKGLHRTAYAAFVLVTAHVALAPHAPATVVIVLTLTVVGLGTLRGLPRRRQRQVRAGARYGGCGEARGEGR